MKFKIDIPIQSNQLLNYQIPILAVGSCFADRIASKLLESRFDVYGNPYGILYNPVSISHLFVGDDNNDERNLIEVNGLWHSWNHHGSFSKPQKNDLVEQIDKTRKQVQERLTLPKVNVLITLGSAWVYSYENRIVANCHKIPESSFVKNLLTVKQVTAALSEVIRRYPQHNFIFTVSPVRYIKDGMHNSNLSKSILHLSVNQLVEEFSNCSYFPAYELVIDELRDYRFFDTDMLHPNNLAVDYVWEKFKASFIDTKSQSMIQAWNKVKSMLDHRILHPETKEAESFAAKLAVKKAEFEANYF